MGEASSMQTYILPADAEVAMTDDDDGFTWWGGGADFFFAEFRFRTMELGRAWR
jgi:hypothetical protein